MDVRLTEASAAMLGVLEDIHLLSMTDYVVCTHSSNVRQYLYSIVPKRTIYVNFNCRYVDYFMSSYISSTETQLIC